MKPTNRVDKRKTFPPFGGSFDIIFTFLNFIGIDSNSYSYAQKPNKCFQIFLAIRRWILITSTALYVGLILAQLLYSPISIVELVFFIGNVASNVELIIFYLVFSVRKKTLTTFFARLNNTCASIMGTDRSTYKTTRNFVWFYIGAIIFLFFVLILFGFTDYIRLISNHQNETVYDGNINPAELLKADYLIGFPILHYIFETLKMYFVFFSALESWFCGLVFQLTYMTIAFLIWTNFSHLKRTLIGECDSSLNERVLVYIRHHQMLCEVVNLFNDFYCETVVMWSFVDIFNIVMTCRALDFHPNDPNWRIDREASLTVVMNVYVFIFRSALAAAINDEVEDSLLFLTEVDEKTCDVEFQLNSKVSVTSSIYFNYVKVDPPCLRGWFLYSIKKGLILKAAANVLTYVLVLYSIAD